MLGALRRRRSSASFDGETPRTVTRSRSFFRRTPPKGRLEEHAAAQRVQSIYRGFKARKDRASERASAMAIQACHRGSCVRKQLYHTSCDLLGRTSPKDVVNEVELMTPDSNWFMPKAGWPKHLLQNRKGWFEPPKNLIPTAKEAPSCMFDGTDVIGELRIEVLEAARLKNMDLFGASDPYALILFESYAARTNAWRATSRPTWGPDDPRAFCFPVRSPYSKIYVGVKDADNSTADDNIGRVVVELASLIEHSVYDSWLPLSYFNINPPGKVGEIRLRYSVRFHSDRDRLMRYVSPMATPTFYVPFVDAESMHNARFVLLGKKAEIGFSMTVLKQYYVELIGAITDTRDDIKESILTLLFWDSPRSATISIVCLVWWQYLVSHPQFVPASLPLLLLCHLLDRYLNSSCKYAIQRQPPLSRLCAMLFFPTWIKRSPLNAVPVDRASVDGSSDQEEAKQWWNTRGPSKKPHLAKKKSDKQQRASGTASSVAASLKVAGTMVEETTMQWLASMAANWDENSELEGSFDMSLRSILDQYELEIAEEQVYAVRNDMDYQNPEKNLKSINPLAAYLAPVQYWLGQAIVPMRAMRRLLNWDDRILTFWAACSLVIATILLAIIPWAIVIYYSLRLVGILLFGPHMYFVGKHWQKQTAEEERAEKEFQELSEAGKVELLAEHRARMMAEHKQRLDEERRDMLEDNRQLEEYLRSNRYTMAIDTMRGSSNLKYRALPDPHRSKAYPLRKSPIAN